MDDDEQKGDRLAEIEAAFARALDYGDCSKSEAADVAWLIKHIRSMRQELEFSRGEIDWSAAEWHEIDPEIDALIGSRRTSEPP